jgi:hypothetical protein
MDEALIFEVVGGDQPEVDPTIVSTTLGTMNKVT